MKVASLFVLAAVLACALPADPPHPARRHRRHSELEAPRQQRDLWGGANDSNGAIRNAQDLGSLLGKILRVRVVQEQATTTDGFLYTVPADNPFAQAPRPAGQAGPLHSIYAYRMQNPYSYLFDRSDDTLWCADVGQDSIEEINVMQKDDNDVTARRNFMSRFRIVPVRMSVHDAVPSRVVDGWRRAHICKGMESDSASE
ncbi:hypothetical protein JKP88DRAFT_248758 [Tribonema minus]|uniref:Glucose/Sorbosone dehydrogenase domain-containing protein n=1 Tax=Tribonema minus TaxID=303371 RepID=A0A835YLI5_9STRA|nr:hypothetical protein JKP88DRAFT_248758 [Tribonema minus]